MGAWQQSWQHSHLVHGANQENAEEGEQESELTGKGLHWVCIGCYELILLLLLLGEGVSICKLFHKFK
jgi:hypothetical protein